MRSWCMKEVNRAFTQPATLSVWKARKLNLRSSNSGKFFPNKLRSKMFFSASSYRLTTLLRVLTLPSSSMDKRGQVKHTQCRVVLANLMAWSNKHLSTLKQPYRGNRVMSTSFLAKWYRSTILKWQTFFCLRTAEYANFSLKKTKKTISLPLRVQLLCQLTLWKPESSSKFTTKVWTTERWGQQMSTKRLAARIWFSKSTSSEQEKEAANALLAR